MCAQRQCLRPNRVSAFRIVFAVLLLCLACGAPALAQTDTTWTFDGDGNWTDGGVWDNGEPVDATFNAFIDDGDTAVTVSLNVSRTIGDLTIGSDDQMTILNIRTLVLDGDLFNSGTLRIESGGNITDLALENATTFSGGGEVVLTHVNSRILDQAGSMDGHLINQDNTIRGLGQIGVDRMQITNHAGGTIDADVSGQTLNIDPNASGLANMGTMQASGGGVLRLFGGLYTNNGGTIQALDGSSVLLSGAHIVGGTLATAGSGIVQTSSSAALEELTTTGHVRVNNNSNLQLIGTINNSGTIDVASGGNITDLSVESDVTLTGGGDVLLSHVNSRLLDGGGDPLGHLINFNNTIHGYGQIGVDRMQITNQAGGTIDADVSGQTLNIDPNTSGLANMGTMQASGGGVLQLLGGLYTNNGGTIQALDGSSVLLSGAHIVGGTLATAGSGIVQTSSSAALEELTTTGHVRVNNNSNLQLIGTINNSGTIDVASGGNNTDLSVESEVTLTGGGEVLLSHLSSRLLDGAGSTDGHLINQDNTIHGYGQIGAARMGMTNRSLVNADVDGQTLWLDLRNADANPDNGPDALVNSGRSAPAGGGQLVLADSRFENYEGTTGGVIEAIGIASRVRLRGTHVVGGVLQTSLDGVIDTYDSSLNVLEDVTIDGIVKVNNNHSLELRGTIINVGNTIEVNSAGNNTDLRVEGEVTLIGGGEVVLSHGNSRLLDGVSDPLGHLINVNNTIRGYGQIGVDRMQITNQAGGTIDANVSGQALNIDPNTSGLANMGTMQASGEGVLQLFGGLYTNNGGTVQALDGSSVLLSGAHIVGGTLATAGSGIVQTSSSAALEELTTTGHVRVNNNSNLQLIGTINNSGTIDVASGGNNTDLSVESEVALNGGGEVVLSHVNSRLLDGSGDPLGHLINVNNTIRGYGQIGVDRMQITNQAGGTIDANVSGQALNIDPNTSGLANMGTMQASGEGVLQLFGGLYTNNGGTVQALDGSSVLLSGAHIVGGTLATAGSGIVQTSSSAALEELTTTGHVRVNNNSNLQLIGTINNSGTIDVASGGNNTDLLVESEVTLNGGGEVLLSHVNSRLLDGGGNVEGRLINEDNTIRGRGQLGAGRLIEVVSNGAIIGESPAVRMPVSVPLSGTGSLENVDIQSAYSPGGSPAAIDMDGMVQFANSATLELEIGGPVPGDEFDRLDSLGDVAVDGTLQIEQIDLGGGIFQPEFGDAFLVITAVGELTGAFDTVNAVNLNPILVYEVFYDYDADTVTLGLDSFFDADFDVDGDVDGDDFLIWQSGFGKFLGGDATQMDGDANEDGFVDGDDFLIWQNQFGASVGGPEGNGSAAVPEPGAGLLALAVLAFVGSLSGSRFRRR